MGIDLRAQIFIACRPAGRITLAHCLELLARFRFHILRQNLRSVDNTERTKLQRQLAAVGQTSVSFARCKLKEVAQTAELTAPQIQRSQLDDNLSRQPRVKRIPIACGPTRRAHEQQPPICVGFIVLRCLEVSRRRTFAAIARPSRI